MDFYDTTELFLLRLTGSYKSPPIGKYASLNNTGKLILPTKVFSDVDALLIVSDGNGSFIARSVPRNTPSSHAIKHYDEQTTYCYIGAFSGGEKQHFSVKKNAAGNYIFTLMDKIAPTQININDIKRNIHAFDTKRYLAMTKGSGSFRISKFFGNELISSLPNVAGMYCLENKVLRLVPTDDDISTSLTSNSKSHGQYRILVRNKIVLDGLCHDKTKKRYRVPVVSSSDGSYYAAARDNPFWQDIGLSRDMGIGL